MTEQNEYIKQHTTIQGCFKASAAVILLLWSTVSILLIRSLASSVTLSHSGEGNCEKKKKRKKKLSMLKKQTKDELKSFL